MRHRILPIAIGVLTVAAVATAQAGARASRLPHLIAGSYSGIKPSLIDFSADGGNVVTGLKWSEWGSTKALGKGTSEIQSCVPNCATGKEKAYPTTITLSRVRDGHFTKVVEFRDHFSYTAYYGRPAWAEGASR